MIGRLYALAGVQGTQGSLPPLALKIAVATTAVATTGRVLLGNLNIDKCRLTRLINTQGTYGSELTVTGVNESSKQMQLRIINSI